MSDMGKDLSIRVMEILKPILPKGTGFIMICGNADDENLGITSNLPDDLALEFLKAAIDSIRSEPAVLIEKEIN